MRIVILAALLALGGCAAQSQMSADQLKALAQDKNFSAVCSTLMGPYGTGKFVYVNVDKSVVINGAISVDANCLVTMSNEATAAIVGPKPPVLAPVPAPPAAPVKSP